MAEVLIFPAARTPDWRERERALDTRQSWIVEAPAGSGKTGLLIQRFLKLLAEESVTDPGQVLAITFTTKATSEMRERVLAQLAGAAAGAEPKTDFDRATRPLAEEALEKDRRLGWDLLANPRRLAIRTIDAVCAGIARALPVLSGSGGGQAPVADATELYREAARRTLGLLGSSDAALTRALTALLLHRDGNLADCEALLAEMLQWRDQWGELVPLARHELDDAYLEGTVLLKIERALELAICKALTRLSQAMPYTSLWELTELAVEMAKSDGYNGKRNPIAICRELSLAPTDAAQDIDHWRALAHLLITASTKGWRGGFNKNQIHFEIEPGHRNILKAIVARLRGDGALLDALCGVMALPPLRYPQEQWIVTKALFRVLSRALVELQIVFAERGECDFAEVGLLARGALQRDAALDDLAAANGLELRHLLVDEMQDTSTSQYGLIQLLTRSWDGQSQTVFLVGDPKQSIYLFRQARVERFVRTMLTERLGEIPVGCLRLRANFRSQAKLVAAFNDDFSRLFPRDADAGRPEEVPYVEAVAVRPSSATQGRAWHAATIPYTDDAEIKRQRRRSQTRAEADAVCEIVQAWQTGSSTMAVLVRSRIHLTAIVAEFKRRAIPYRAVEIEALGERQEILDLLALTRALLHPADRVAWFAVLRAPWCGLTVFDLHRLAGVDDPQWSERALAEVIAERGHELSDDGIARLERVWPVLLAAAAKRGRLPVAEWVERTWRSLGADHFASEEEMANVRRYLRLLDELEEPGGGLRMGELKRRLAKLYAEAAVHPGAVDLMTIHGAKGLEWELVIVPALEKTGRHSNGRLLTWMEIDEGDGDEIAHGILAPIVSKGGASKELNDWMKSIESARAAAERKRLFYVACTRAREELHLFASPGMTLKGEVSVTADTLLYSAWPAAEEHFATSTVTDQDVPFDLPLAAAAESARVPQLLRIPNSVVSETAARLPYGAPSKAQPGELFARPEGSFAARAFGNAVHAFLELLAARIGAGDDAVVLLGELDGWQGRVAALLRGEGLPAASIDRMAVRVHSALSNTLRDPHGLWVLGAHADAASEQTLVARDAGGVLRMDRTFIAGAEPLTTGATTRWIIDFKTTMHGREGLDDFLAKERAQYEAQMNAYARQIGGDGMPVRVGLYFPLVPRLLWWGVEEQ